MHHPTAVAYTQLSDDAMTVSVNGLTKDVRHANESYRLYVLSQGAEYESEPQLVPQ